MSEASERRHRGLQKIFFAKAGVGVAIVLALAAGYWLRSQGLTVGEFANELRRDDTPRYEWKSIDKKHWQASAGGVVVGERPELTDAREATSAGCATGMVRVKGAFHKELHGESTGEIERLQDSACVDWISREFPARCRTFDPVKIATELAKLPTQSMDYCIDRFEHPNVLGQNPMIVATFREAEAICKKGSKRLCSENEWTFACEGEEARPYPYGWTRDATACVIDRSWRPFGENALQPRNGAKAREELDRLWQGEPSGSRNGCRSPFGVYDLTGNVDEWTRSVNAKGYASVLKGGYWGPVRARCRPSTRAHNEDFVAYQQSFRCCGESNAAVPAPRVTPPVAVLADAGAAPRTSQLQEDNDDGDAAARQAVATHDPDPGSTTPFTPSSSPEEDDELIAIRKARIGLCASVPGARNEVPFAAAASMLPLLVLVRRRRGRSTKETEIVAAEDLQHASSCSFS